MNARLLAGAILLSVLCLAATLRSVAQEPGAPTIGKADTLVYVGTYTNAKSKGIYLFKLDARHIEGSKDAALVPLGLAAETPSPSFLEIDAKRGLVFAVNEVDQFEGKPSGAVSAFSIDRATGKLTLLNQRASMGRGPCHLVLDRTGRYLFVANYGSGTVAVLPVGTDGRLGEATSVVQHAGQSINPDRQKGPHAHCMTVDAANRFVFACDLGLDKILTYRFDAQKGTLTASDPAFTPIKPGAGPRHMVFRPDGRFAYVINELTSTVTALAYDPKTGVMSELQTLSTLPQSFTGANSGAEIDVHPSGKFLYASNRGHNSVAVFGIDAQKGTLTYVDAIPTEGRTPRHFGIDPSGKYAAVANQATDTVFPSAIDPATGRLKLAAVSASVPTPVCVRFVPVAALSAR